MIRAPRQKGSRSPRATRSRVAWDDDAVALAVLAAVLALVVGQRLAFDAWLTDFDILTQYLPWYAHLGERLRSGDIPGWNPSQFSGAPFAADPQSGWTYLPAMAAFAALPPVAAYKAMIATQVVIAALSTYALARALGAGALAALAGALAYACGPFLHWGADGATIMAHVAAWLPLGLLGVAVGTRAATWRRTVVGWSAGALGVSQVVAGWPGQGALYGLLAVGSFAAYRAVMPPGGSPTVAAWRRGALTGAAVLGLGLGLAAAGLLPRLAVNAETTVSDAYDRLVGTGATYPPIDAATFLFRVMGTGAPYRAYAWGGGVVVLALLAPFLAWRRCAVPFFAALTLGAVVLTQAPTPLHRLLYLLPRFRELHEHDPVHSLVLAPVGVSVLVAATVDTIAPGGTGRWGLAATTTVGGVLAGGVGIAWHAHGFVGWPPLAAAAVALAGALLGCATAAAVRGRWVSPAVAALLFVAVVAQPAGVEVTGAWLGWPRDPTWANAWGPDAGREQVIAANASATDPGGAGAFLQERLAVEGPFRYVGYGGFDYPGDEARRRSYMTRRFDPRVTALLVNGRPLRLGLLEVQGYNPVQLRRYAEFVTAMNGKRTNYHILYVLPGGTASPLLELLDVRYVVLDASLPPDRDDVVAITTGRREVFRTDLVVVYEDPTPPPHAWVVHDVRSVAPGAALPLLLRGDVDPRRTALVEAAAPNAENPTGAAAEEARVVRHGPDYLAVEVEAAAPGLLVVSEVFASGWKAEVDGRPATILPTDHILRGVPVPAGRHVVEFRYAPRSLAIGLLTSAATAAALGTALAAAAVSRARRAAPKVSACRTARDGAPARRSVATPRRATAGQRPRAPRF